MCLRKIGLGWMLFGVWTLMASAAWAAPQGEVESGDYKLMYSVFSSTFLSAEMAQSYNIKRSAKEVIVNVSLIQKSTNKPVAASNISGSAKNLLQQQRSLQFREIREENAIYYIAVLRTTEKEVFHFLLQVTPPDGAAFDAKFTQELFVNP